MVQREKPEDFVLATGKAHSFKEFVKSAFLRLGIDIVFEGKGVQEKGIDLKSGKVVVEVNPEFFRPSEVDFLMGDPSKALEKLGWKASTSFQELVSLMVESDYQKIAGEKLFSRESYLL